MDPLSAYFNAKEVINTGDKVIKNINNEMMSKNKYDDVLKNTIVKAPTSGGVLNAVNSNPMFRYASDELNNIYKLATQNSYSNRGNRSGNTRDRNENNRAYPSNLVEIHPTSKDKINPFVTAGGTILGAGIAKALIFNDAGGVVDDTINGLNKFMYKAPKKILSRNKHTRDAFDVIKEGVKPIRNKRASEVIADMYEKTASTVLVDVDEKLRNLTKEEKEKLERRGNRSLVHYDKLREGILKQKRMEKMDDMKG